MTLFGYIKLASLLALALAPPSLLAQPAIAPASTIRVIEVVDPYSGERERQVAEDLTPAEISRLQHALAAAGFDPGRATGQWNATTRLELGRFQASRGLLQCECITYETLVALRIHPEVVASIRAPLDGGYGSRTVVLVPAHGRHFFGHGTGVIVGHGPSVIVGHQPARGAGELGRRSHVHDRRPHVRDHGHDRGVRLDPRPSRPRPGSSISGPGAPLRSLTPRQPRPTPPATRPGSR
jgi:hypothetical protein